MEKSSNQRLLDWFKEFCGIVSRSDFFNDEEKDALWAIFRLVLKLERENAALHSTLQGKAVKEKIEEKINALQSEGKVVL